MSLVDDVAAYEAWLRTQCDVVEDGLVQKHLRMKDGAFMFYRATCFRFALTIPARLPELCEAPTTICTGDPHIENFGTWRDAEGRLVWGVNDFDDAARLPYTLDLLRLATSALLAPRLPLPRDERVGAILYGYRTGLDAPRPHFVDRENEWMRILLERPEAKKKTFQHDIKRHREVTPPPNVERALRRRLPKGTLKIRFRARQKGGGGLGRPRYLARGRWHGGSIVREAKALVPSSWDWALGVRPHKHLFLKLARGAFRSPDPFLHRDGHYILRRVAADSQKIDLTRAVAKAFGRDLFQAMGEDLAAIHAAGPVDMAEIQRDLRRRPADWLNTAAETAERMVRIDYREWVRAGP